MYFIYAQHLNINNLVDAPQIHDQEANQYINSHPILNGHLVRRQIKQGEIVINNTIPCPICSSISHSNMIHLNQDYHITFISLTRYAVPVTVKLCAHTTINQTLVKLGMWPIEPKNPSYAISMKLFDAYTEVKL